MVEGVSTGQHWIYANVDCTNTLASYNSKIMDYLKTVYHSTLYLFAIATVGDE